jgi:hypothetical protein
MSGPRAGLGFPENDAAVPFVIQGAPGDDGLVPVVAGLIHGSDGLRDVDGVMLPPADATATFDRALEHSGLGAVPVHVALGFALKAVDAAPVPAAWEAVWSGLSEGTRNTAQLTDPLRGLVDTLTQAGLEAPSALLHPEGPALYGLSAEVAEDVVPLLLDTVAGRDFNDGLTPRARIAALITQAADDSLNADTRTAWGLALDILAYRAHAGGDAGLSASCRHTALAMRAGYYGSEVPFVRVWVERSLRTLVESARALSGPGPVGPRIAAARAATSAGDA